MTNLNDRLNDRHARSNLAAAGAHLRAAGLARTDPARAAASPQLAARMRWARRVLASAVSNSPCIRGETR